MSENGLTEAIALVFDGTGYGTDGTLWGGELLHVHPAGFNRMGRLKPSALPGGERSVREPWRQALARLTELSLSQLEELKSMSSRTPTVERACLHIAELLGLFADRTKARARRQFLKVLLDASDATTASSTSPLSTNFSSSMGRLFDAVAALLGLAPCEITYEAEAAIRLEQRATEALKNGARLRPYALPLAFLASDELLEVDPSPMIHQLIAQIIQESVDGRLPQTSLDVIAARFHLTIAALATQWLIAAHQRTGLRDIVISGGVFQNRLLSRLLLESMQANAETRALKLHLHQRLPSGDACLSYGQAHAVTQLRFNSTPITRTRQKPYA